MKRYDDTFDFDIHEGDIRKAVLLRNNGLSDLSYMIGKDEECDLTIVDFSSSSFSSTIEVTLEENASFSLHIFSLVRGNDSKIITVNVRHEGQNSFSRVEMVGVDISAGDFKMNGNSYIRKGAKKSDTRQEGRIMNLVENARSEVSPALYIDENDVKASHGAVLGAYDKNQIFYLMSRGITEEESKKMLSLGYIIPVVSRLEDKNLLEETKTILEEISL